MPLPATSRPLPAQGLLGPAQARRNRHLNAHMRTASTHSSGSTQQQVQDSRQHAAASCCKPACLVGGTTSANQLQATGWARHTCPSSFNTHPPATAAAFVTASAAVGPRATLNSSSTCCCLSLPASRPGAAAAHMQPNMMYPASLSAATAQGQLHCTHASSKQAEQTTVRGFVTG